jgi:hypothetical protein
MKHEDVVVLVTTLLGVIGLVCLVLGKWEAATAFGVITIVGMKMVERSY